MITKISRMFLTAVLFFVLHTNVQAQDKYDYAMVTYKYKDKILEVDINGENYERIDVKEPVNTYYYLAPPALKQVKKMNNEGWELFDTSNTGIGTLPVFVFYLRKKVE